MSRSIPSKYYDMFVDCKIQMLGVNIKNIHMNERSKLEQSDIDQMIEVDLDPENINDIKKGFNILLSRKAIELNKKLEEGGAFFLDIQCTGDINE